jgi:hypothetical protein
MMPIVTPIPPRPVPRPENPWGAPVNIPVPNPST